MKNRGILLLAAFSLFALFVWPKINSQKYLAEKPPVMLGPLTVQEKMLLGIPLPMNKLTIEEWEALPHIGPKVAERIVTYRLKNVSFQSVEELLEVSGIGPKTLTVVRPFLALDLH